jgi:hypothetical protein
MTAMHIRTERSRLAVLIEREHNGLLLLSERMMRIKCFHWQHSNDISRGIHRIVISLVVIHSRLRL